MSQEPFESPFTHRGCGGNIEMDWSKTYEHEGCTVPAYRCEKCKVEIVSDWQIVGLDEEQS